MRCLISLKHGSAMEKRPADNDCFRRGTFLLTPPSCRKLGAS